jgi:hypothetical protein
MLDGVVFAEKLGLLEIVQFDRSVHWIDDDHQRCARAQVDMDFVVDVGAAIVGRENFNGNVGRKRRDRKRSFDT